MKNVNSNPTYRANRKLYGHDLSQHLSFTSSVGHLLPVYYDVLSPGEKVSIKTYMKTRTQPLASNAMCKIEEHLEWYFVPMHQIYKPFGNWYYGVQDFDSSLYSTFSDPIRLEMKFPYLTSDMLIALYGDHHGNTMVDTLMGEAFYPSYVRLMSHLGVDDSVLMDFDGLLSESDKFSITPLLLCAYQKIFMDYYRDSNRIENDPECYNLDRFFNSSDINGDVGSDILLKFAQLRYRPLRKDFFTNVYPSPLFGPNSVGAQKFIGFEPGSTYESTLEGVNQWLTNLASVNVVNASGSGGTVGGSEPTRVILPNGAEGTSVNYGQFTRANIETLFAADKLLEITRRAGKHYDAQTLAHFGVQVPETIEGMCHRIGAHTQPIIIGDVIATADTSAGDPGSLTGAPLGEVGGKGYSAEQSKSMSYTVPCHGVLMAIYSAAPSQDYYDYGLDKLNCLINKQDFFVPEYDNLGMQPLFKYQANLSSVPQQAVGSVYGWQYRYMEFKQKINRIISGMKYTQKHWTVGRDSYRAAGSEVDAYYVSPSLLDSIMLYGYNNGYSDVAHISPVSTASGIYESDPLLHEIFFDVKKASQMSTFGLMSL